MKTISGYSCGGYGVTNSPIRSAVYVPTRGVADPVVEMAEDFGEDLQFDIPQHLELEQLDFKSPAISVIEGAVRSQKKISTQPGFF